MKAKLPHILTAFLLCFANLTTFGQEETQVTTGLKDGHTIVIVKEPNKKEYWHYAAGCKMLTVTIESPTRCKKCDTESQQEEAKKKDEADKKRAENKAKEKNENTTATDPTNTEINRSGTERNTNNSNTTSTTNPYMNEVNAYNAKTRADAQALDNAADQTMNAWGNELAKGKNADFVSTAKPLVGEFAKQGNATAAYGTVGVAVGAQVISMIGSGKSREERLEDKGILEITEGAKYLNDFDFVNAYSKFSEAVQNDNSVVFALCNMGYMTLLDLGVERNENEAFELFSKAVEIADKSSSNNYHYAYHFLGVMHAHGYGTPRDNRKAYDYFEKAINLPLPLDEAPLGKFDNKYGSPSRFYTRACSYLYMAKLLEFTDDYKKNAIGYYKNSIDMAKPMLIYGSPAYRDISNDAHYRLGLLYKELGDNKSAYKFLKKAAKKGEDNAQNSIGYFYQFGLDYVVPKDLEKAEYWYTKSAEQNNFTGLNNLGALQVTNGKYVEAEKNLQQAIQLGNNTSRPYYHLGRLYETTNKIDKAKEMYTKAADMGDKQAQEKLDIK
ncbi:TPR repeat [Sinomicrobium oceani]|uniref:TPR repeat n=1 Tax=Sinomicrobium oceani TaxID=1150368 RepID=A0A1K1PY86_9FLAO|nr:SEL1-like repeat protein [Sinomicrobium oceani]SFW52608.1 TPR repeat [Sinomicrobium oceani]